MRTSQHDDREPSRIGIWWKRFNHLSVGRWRTTLYITAFALLPLLLFGRGWMFIAFGSVETTGYVTKQRDAAYYRVGEHRYTTQVNYFWHGGFHIWGDPVIVRYLPLFPAISWLQAAEPYTLEQLVPSLVAYIAFVAIPLMWLWWINILRTAFRYGKVSSASHPPCDGGRH